MDRTVSPFATAAIPSRQPPVRLDFAGWSGGLRLAVDQALIDWRGMDGTARLWARDAALWSGGDEAAWLDWLDVTPEAAATIQAQVTPLVAGLRDIVLLGMGGSSLGPEVVAAILGDAQPGPKGAAPHFHMLDTTDPAQIRALEARIDPVASLFIIASKSGTTLESSLMLDYFRALLIQRLGSAEAAGRHLVAITDPGTALAARAEAEHFAACFAGKPRIGGRYSVLSPFGLVPAAAIGIDLAGFLDGAAQMAAACATARPDVDNPGVRLGLALGEAARAGRDKLTVLAEPALAPFGAWLEQLVAESTGKQGRAIIPIDGEPPAAPEVYGTDRLFLHLIGPSAAPAGPSAAPAGPDAAPAGPDAGAGRGEARLAPAVAALVAAGHPVIRLTLSGLADLGGLFFLWQFAVAVAGARLGINPFDQPDVEASKRKTSALTQAVARDGALPADPPLFVAGGISLRADPGNQAELGEHADLAGYLAAHFGRARPGDYAALLAYLTRNPAHDVALTRIRRRLRDRFSIATAVGYGPRFLHSTGQAYKGGPNTGLFLQITGGDVRDLAVPGRPFSFGQVKAAQARGDAEVLTERGRRLLRLHLDDPANGLAQLEQALIDAGI